MKEETGRVVLERLNGLQVGEGMAHRQMVVFPLVSTDATARTPLDYRTLGEAIAEGWVEVTERAAASVPELVLRNRGRAMVLVLDGEEIVGGKQNRIVNASFLVAAGSEVALPVSCVEHGRWHDVAPRFEAGDTTYYSLRREKVLQVRANLRTSGRPVADQSAIWEHIARKQEETKAAAPTGAMHDIYRAKEGDLGRYEDAFPYVREAVGFIVALNGHLAGADLFDQARTAEVLWTKLLRSYALDARDGGAANPVSRERALRFLARTRDAGCEVYPSLALGEDVRLQGDGVIGSALVYNSTAVHISLFRTADQRQGPGFDATGITSAATRRRLRSFRPYND